MLLYIVWENRRRDRAMCETDSAASCSEDVMDGIVANLSDKTDKELARFRYIYWFKTRSVLLLPAGMTGSNCKLSNNHLDLPVYRAAPSCNATLTPSGRL